MEFSFQEIYPKLIHPQNKGSHCTTDHFFKAKLLLTTRNSRNSISTIDRTSACQLFKTCQCSLVEANIYQIKGLHNFLKQFKVSYWLPEVPSDWEAKYYILYFIPSFFSLFINHHIHQTNGYISSHNGVAVNLREFGVGW